MEQTNLPMILEKIKRESFFSGFMFDNLLTREEWANVLGIHRQSVRRWEKEIINKVAPIQSNYYTVSRMRSPYLDAYQRFVLALIYVVKGGLDRLNKPHAFAVDFLKLNFTSLKREQFEQWRKNNVQV
ncbi:MAG: hypothetical protein KME52_27930 [Desmonostoc geniculatum HA4340-LM1]|jgi:hypothetical protein|nr:hypothetical protein [Desmonostoc geniculatum HA4340-LM1]